MFSADLIGMAGLLQTLTRGHRVEEAARRSLGREAEKLAEEMKAAVHVQSGHLRDSIRVEPGDEPLSVTVLAGNDENTLKVSSAGVTYDEALINEYGTSRQEAHPFFWSTINQKRDQIAADISGDMTDAGEDDQ